METKTQENQGRVRESSLESQNIAIDEALLASVRHNKNSSQGEISKRLEELNQEWDIERLLEVNASSLILIGLTLGTFVDKKWYVLPGIIAGFLLQHGLQGWCPPLPLFRSFGVRTRLEIDEERYALKLLRGDFKDKSTSEPHEIINAIKKP